ncbi:MAG: DUF3883 domain-containing protein [Lysobacteraceae bacterium]|nr:MAG: DUF3883 domain-containing protein [Xanthomonadaceae bacterium]
MTKPILFCNIGWMREYRGISSRDNIIGGGKYVALQKHGHEVCNFFAAGNRMYGYVQPRGEQIRIERLGALTKDEWIDRVDVVFTARRPGVRGGTFVIGWYRDARVYRHIQPKKWLSKTHQNNKVDGYYFLAPAGNSRLLKEDERTAIAPVPRGPGGMGQSNVWYAQDKAVKSWVSEIRKILDKDPTESETRRRGRTSSDPAMRKRIEDIGMNEAQRHYERMGYRVEPVHRDNRGWDLEASKPGGVTLLIEAKGLSGAQIHIELTPNEYKKSQDHRQNYRLCIVTKALTKPKLRVFVFNPVNERWTEESEGVELSVEERTAAVLWVGRGQSRRE